MRARGVTANGLIGDILQILSREVRCVGDRAKVRDKGRVDVSDSFPVDAVEEGMRFDVFDGQSLVLACDESDLWR